jgi:hypothetical protein
MTRLPLPHVSVDIVAAGEDPPEKDEQKRRDRRCAALDGFYLHAGTPVATQNRLGLE